MPARFRSSAPLSASSSPSGGASGPSPSAIPNQPKPPQRVPKARQDSILLDPWLTAAPSPQGKPLATVVGRIMADVPKLTSSNAEASHRRSEIIATILANFISTYPAPIAVPQGQHKETRYDRLVITGRQLKPTLDALETAGMIVRTPAIFKQRRTIVEPTARLAELIAAHHVTTASIIRMYGEEVIILRQRKARTDSESEGANGDDHGGATTTARDRDDGDLIDYPDACPEANALRSELRRYNTFLSQSDIRVVGIDNPPPPKPFKRIFALPPGPTRWDLHGRLYAGQVGGWHQALPKSERHLVRINGEKIVEIDFNAMHLRLAYAEARCSPPSGDLYAIPGLEAYRPAIKIVCSAMVSITGELTRLPPSVREASPGLPKQWTAKRIRRAVKQHHAPIAHLFGNDRGIAFMNRDSTILMRVLTRLMDRGLPGLGLHDAILVQQSAKDIAIAIMQQAAMELLGVELPVSLKSTGFGLPVP